jgi:hypothetical protein
MPKDVNDFFFEILQEGDPDPGRRPAGISPIPAPCAKEMPTLRSGSRKAAEHRTRGAFGPREAAGVIAPNYLIDHRSPIAYITSLTALAPV